MRRGNGRPQNGRHPPAPAAKRANDNLLCYINGTRYAIYHSINSDDMGLVQLTNIKVLCIISL